MPRRSASKLPKDLDVLLTAAARAQAAGRLSAAIRSLEQAAQSYPSSAGLWNNLAALQLLAGHVVIARDNFLRSLQTRADPQVFSNFLRTLLFDPATTPEQLFEWHSRYGLFVEELAPPSAHIPRGHRGPIRIGYISDGFRAHPSAGMLSAALRYHSERFSVFCYPTSSITDSITTAIQKLGGQWRSLAALSDDQAMEQIRRDRIDILIEISGHHGPNRLPILARRPAPVQISLNAYPATLGIPAIDCRISDEIIDPPGAERHYTERFLLRLPRPAFCYVPPPRSPRVGPLPALTNGFITFAAFHRLAKLSDLTIHAWCEILRQTKSSRLLLHHAFNEGLSVNRELKAEWAEQFSRHGVDPRRLRWIGSRSLHETMELYNQCDIGLDTFPYSGGATTREALWMGVPVVTLAGGPAASRHSASYLTAVGMNGWVTVNPQDFIRQAVEKAADTKRLAVIRRGLRRRMKTSALMDEAGLIRHLETACVHLWKQWLAEHFPER